MNDDRLVLFDLDFTLYEAYGNWRRPLAGLFRRNLGTKAFPWTLYFDIRGHNEVFEIFYEKSFRHHGLTAELAALRILLFEKRISATALLNDLQSIEFRLDLLKRIFPRPGSYALEAKKYCLSFPTFRSAIEGVKERSTSPQVVDVVSRYSDSLRFRAYPGVVEALEFLKERGIPFYLASEGDYDQQRFKCKLLGLDGYFSQRTLASEIYKLNRCYRASRKTIEDALADGSYAEEMDSPGIRRADEEVRRFDLLKHKEDLHYYISALNAIDSDRDNPEEFLRTVDSDDVLTTNIDLPSGVIMVGDRNDKDMYPVWQLLKEKALLIRMRAGKYKNDPRSPDIPRGQYAECPEFRQVYTRLRETFAVRRSQ